MAAPMAVPAGPPSSVPSEAPDAAPDSAPEKSPPTSPPKEDPTITSAHWLATLPAMAKMPACPNAESTPEPPPARLSALLMASVVSSRSRWVCLACLLTSWS